MSVSDLIPRFQSLGFLVDPIDWNGLFKIDPRMIHPRRFGVAVANTLGGIMYNKTKVPKENIPKTWDDCTKPFFKGKMATEVRPQQFTELAADKGEEWAVEYAKKIAANKPKWMSSGTAALTLMVAGEILVLCPTSYGTWYRQASRNPNFPVGWVFPEGTILGDQQSASEPDERRSQCQRGDTICRLGREQRAADTRHGARKSLSPGHKAGQAVKGTGRQSGGLGFGGTGRESVETHRRSLGLSESG